MSDLFKITGTYTDLYQLTMGQVYFLTGQKNNHAVYDYFFRKLPFEGGYVVFAGLRDVLEIIENLRFSSHDLVYLKERGFDNDFINYLKDFRFTGTIYSSHEGDVVFPTRPVLRVEGSIIEAQVIETLILNVLNFQSLIATKAARMRWVAGDRILTDFGLRRAQSLGGYHATRASIIGGFDSTSNVKTAADFDLPVVGTMAHAFIQSYDDELSAFRHFAEGRPEQCVLLVDTYNTLESGIPNAITIAKEMEQKGKRLQGIRLDSGDLAYLSKRSRQILNDAGLNYVQIAASNQLDEYVIKSLLEQHAPIDIFGVGTNLVTGQPDGALDGVYKLCYADGKPRIKISETLKKTTLPDRKQVYRIYESKESFLGADAIVLNNEKRVDHMYDPFEPYKSLSLRGLEQEPLLHKVMEKGKILIEKQSLSTIANYCRQRLSFLPEEYKRFQNPHSYKVGISKSLMYLRDEIKNHFVKQ